MELRRQVWRYCAANGGGLLEILDPSCWSNGMTPGPPTASTWVTVPVADAERYEMARAQQQALLTPMANNIASSGRAETPLFRLAIDGVTNFLRGVPESEPNAKRKPAHDEHAEHANDDHMEWERKQLLSDLFSAAEMACQRTALHSIISRLGLEEAAETHCMHDLDTLESALGL